MLNLQTIKELYISTIVLLISLIFAIIIINKLSNLLINFKIPYLFVFTIHVFLIVGFVYLLRLKLQKMILNKDILSSTMTIAGPLIGSASLYFSDYIKKLIILI